MPRMRASLRVHDGSETPSTISLKQASTISLKQASTIAEIRSVRIDIQAKLDGARIALQVDIGFGDAVTPVPQTISYPVLLEGFPAAQLRAYPKYTVVAEKFHAVCLLGLVNTRMKDYFDLWVLLDDPTLDSVEVRRAISATFERRKMPMPITMPLGLTDTFAGDTTKQTQWTAFLKKN